MNILSNITNKQLRKSSETIKIKPPLGMCNKTHCKSQCNNKFNYENQLAINKLYYKLSKIERKTFIVENVTKKSV
jgi:hypothetical protein